MARTLNSSANTWKGSPPVPISTIRAPRPFMLAMACYLPLRLGTGAPMWAGSCVRSRPQAL